MGNRDKKIILFIFLLFINTICNTQPSMENQSLGRIDVKPIISISELVSDADRPPSWSPKGDFIAYATTIKELGVWKIRLIDKKKFEIPSLKTLYLAWTPDGKNFVFCSAGKDKYKHYYYISDIEGKDKHPIVDEGFVPNIDDIISISPEGDKIVFEWDAGFREGQQVKKVAYTFPKKGYIIDHRPKDYKGQGIYILDIGTKKIGKLITPAKEVKREDPDHDILAESPSWSPQGNIIIYSVYKKHDIHQSIWFTDLKKNEYAMLISKGYYDIQGEKLHCSFRDSSYSPDGEWIACILGMTKVFENYTEPQPSKICLISRDGTKRIILDTKDVIPLPFGPVSWAPDSKKIAFVGEKDNFSQKIPSRSIWIVEIGEIE